MAEARIDDALQALLNCSELNSEELEPETVEAMERAEDALAAEAARVAPPLPEDMREDLREIIAWALEETANPARAARLEAMKRALGPDAERVRQEAHVDLNDSASSEGCDGGLVVVDGAALARVLRMAGVEPSFEAEESPALGVA